MNEYLTVANTIKTTLEINRSVFICTLKGVESYDEGLAFAKEIAKKYSDATHNCYAMRFVDGSQKFFDDGEPGGTAGQPILQVLKAKDIYNAVAVVTRYFGGIKLGAGGLVSAYSQSAAKSLEAAETMLMRLSEKGTVTLDYGTYQNALSYIRDSGYPILETEYGENVTLHFACPIGSKEKIQEKTAEISAGKSSVTWCGQDYYNY